MATTKHFMLRGIVNIDIVAIKTIFTTNYEANITKPYCFYTDAFI